MKSMNHNDHDLFAGLYSGDILRAVVQALNIEDEVLRSRTARRFFAGESVDEYNRYLVFESLGRALIDYGMVPETVDALPDGVSLAMAVGMGVGLVGERWDHLMAGIHSRGTAAVDVSAVGQGVKTCARRDAHSSRRLSPVRSWALPQLASYAKGQTISPPQRGEPQQQSSPFYRNVCNIGVIFKSIFHELL